MYCKKCGIELQEGSNSCEYCGYGKIEVAINTESILEEKISYSPLWWGILGIFFPIPGLIISIIKRKEKEFKYLVIGLIIGLIIHFIIIYLYINILYLINESYA